MRKFCYLAVGLLLSGLAWQSARAAPWLNPDDGAVRDGAYVNQYFSLSYPLPQGWEQGIAGPGPSVSGYYVLGTFVPAGELTGTILISAQDIFFSPVPLNDVMETAEGLRQATAKIDGMTTDLQPSEVWLAGRRFSRIDFSGVGLFRSTLITEIRCHHVSFNLTAKSPQLLNALVDSLKKIRSTDADDSMRIDPLCIRDYANAEHLLRKVDPAAVVPNFIPIPVRMIIGNDGNVAHVHVIRATEAQRDSIERALLQWKLRPHEVGNRTVEIETGLLMSFTPAGTVRYLIVNPPSRR